MMDSVEDLFSGEVFRCWGNQSLGCISSDENMQVLRDVYILNRFVYTCNVT